MICRFIRWLANRYCQDIIWNRDMSLENDALRIQVERLRKRLEDQNG